MTERVSAADFRHGRDELVEHAALTEQRVGAGFGSICFEMSIHAECLAGSAEECQEDDGEGIDEQEPVAALRIFDSNRAEAHAEAQVLGVTKGGLDGPAFGV